MPLMGVPLVECVCWDRDRFGKDYMGEFDIAVEDIFSDGKIQQEVRSPTFSTTAATDSLEAQMAQAQVEKDRQQKEDRGVWGSSATIFVGRLSQWHSKSGGDL